MPPIHPALVHFPIVLVVLSVVADLIGSWTGNRLLQATGFWSLVAAAGATVVAVAAGYYDMNRATLAEETDGIVHLHLYVGWTVLVAVAALAAWRWWIRSRRPAAWPLGVPYSVAAVLVLGLVGFQGWYGGEMVFAYGVSVAATGQGVEPADAAKRRLRSVYEALGSPGGAGHGEGRASGRGAPAAGASRGEEKSHGAAAGGHGAAR